MLYHVDMTFRNGGIACFGIESDQSDSYVTRCAPIAKHTAAKHNYRLRSIISEYRRMGAHIQMLTSGGWKTFA